MFGDILMISDYHLRRRMIAKTILSGCINSTTGLALDEQLSNGMLTKRYSGLSNLYRFFHETQEEVLRDNKETIGFVLTHFPKANNKLREKYTNCGFHKNYLTLLNG